MDLTGVSYNQINFKIKNMLLKEYHMQTILVLLTGYILSNLTGMDGLSLVFFALMSLMVCLSSTTQATCLLFLFSPLFLYVTIGEFPIYNIILGVLVIKRFLCDKIKIYPWVILTVFYLMIIELAGMFFSGVDFSLNQIKFFLIIYITAMQLYEPAEDYENTTAAKYLIWGTFLYGIFYIITNLNRVINDSMRTGGLGDLDPNTYGLYNLFAISIVLLFIFKKLFSKEETVIYTFIVIAILIAGIMTLSKTYVLVTGLMLFLYWIAKGARVKTSLVYILIIIAIFIIIKSNFYLRETIKQLVSRFTSASTLDELTTGRFGLLTLYIDRLFEKPVVLFLGSGVYSYLSILGLNIRPHNSTLEAICSWGFSGSGIFALMYARGVKFFRKNFQHVKKISFINFIPLIVLFVFMQSLTLLYQEATYAYIIMAIMLIFTPGNDNKAVRR